MFPSLSGLQLTGLLTLMCPWGYVGSLFYLGYSPIELWDGLPGYVHPGIACLAFQASDWLGAFWASLSGSTFKL